MGLNINPFTKVLGNASSLFSSASNSKGGGLSGISFGAEKNKLDGLINDLGGGIGSSLNGATAGLEKLGTAFNGIGNPIQTALGSLSGLSNAASDIGRSINGLGLGGALGSLGGIAGAVSSAAGQLNNVLSIFRGKNIPAAGELFKSDSAAVQLTSSPADDWRVRINCNFGLFGDAFSRLESTNGVVWPYTPKVSVTSKANYTVVDPVHNNYPFNGYKNSQIEDITISGEFSCETEMDGNYWIQATHFFKTATKMFFGGSTYAGNPPVVCQLSGYGPGVFNSIPVIIKSFTIDLPDDVNYIKCSSQFPSDTWVPVLSTIQVTVTPIYNRQLLRKFSLQDYASGNAVGYI